MNVIDFVSSIKRRIITRLSKQVWKGEHYAVIDKKLVWHGRMNLLGKADIYDNLIRVENEQAAAELLEMTEQMGNRSV